MPVREYPESPRTRQSEELLRQLVSEWTSPSEEDDPQTPLILIRRQSDANALHIYVVWDSWCDLEQVERSEIIMDACEQHLGKEEILRVTVAMGLTREEANRMGIRHT